MKPAIRRPHLIVMLKLPRAGQVKTRLGRDIGMTTAAWWFRHQSRRLLRKLEDPRWDITLSVTPDRAALERPVWPRQFPLMPQGGGDLGARMARIFRSLPRGPAVIIGGDIPGIQPQHIARAFRRLGNHEAVFGPATDGGYWLVGMQRLTPPPATLFQNVRWSSQYALSDSIATLGPARIALIETLQDVDNAQDLA